VHFLHNADYKKNHLLNMPTIAIIAPSAYAPNPDYVPRAIQRLQDRGWTVKNLVDPNSTYLRFSADDVTRLAQIYQAAEDPDVDVVMALRGGYGFSRILDEVDFELLAASGKLFVGFSDFTPFHLGLLAKTGKISFAGPMIYDDFGSELEQDFTFDNFKNCLTQEKYSFNVAVDGNPTITARGTFWGGNLAMLAHLVGSEFMPQIKDGILFVEDVNENPYRVERMLLQLHHAGILSNQKALVLGHFTNYRSTEYDNGYGYDSMLSFIRGKIGIPVITGLPFGHCPNKVTLPIGAQATLISNAKQITFEFEGYPHLLKY
jgi:muramoyltetrapeptide carboxypeptidase